MDYTTTRPLRTLMAMMVILALAAFGAGPASAHSVNESYVYFDVTQDALAGRIEVNSKDLTRAIDPGADVWDRPEILSRADEIFAYFDGRMVLQSGAQSYDAAFTEVTFLEETLVDGSELVQLNFKLPGVTPPPSTLQMSYDFLFSDIDPSHRGFALIGSNTRTGVIRNESHISLIFEPGHAPKTLNLDGGPSGAVFVDFVTQGFWHILSGFDHLLFLLTLLLASVMVLAARNWEPAPNLAQALRGMCVVVVTFTLAQAATLALGTFGILSLPVIPADAVITLCIVLVALGNIAPKLHIAHWMLALVYGLVHGLAYFHVLTPLGSDAARKSIGLVAFSTGVGLGQLALVVVLLPILYLIRGTALYRPVFLYAASAALLGLAVFWFTERTFDVLGPVRQLVFG